MMGSKFIQNTTNEPISFLFYGWIIFYCIHAPQLSHMIMYRFPCYSSKSSHSCLLPLSPKVCSLHLCLICCPMFRIFHSLNHSTHWKWPQIHLQKLIWFIEHIFWILWYLRIILKVSTHVLFLNVSLLICSVLQMSKIRIVSWK